MHRHERVLAISISTVLVMMGQGVMAPVLPLFARDLGVGAASAGIAVGAFALARIVFNVPLGALSDHRGRRLLIVGGPLVVAVGMIGSGLAGSLPILVTWRLVAGLGSSMYMTGSLAYLMDIAAPASRTRLLAVNQAALLIGISVGPSLGGLLGANYGLRVPFFAVAGAALLAAVYGYLRLPETVILDSVVEATLELDSAPRVRLKTLATLPFLAIAFANFALFLTRGTAQQALLPLAAVDDFGLDLDAVGLLLGTMALMSLLLLPMASTTADKWGRAEITVPSLAVMAIALVVLGSVTSTSLFVVGGLLLGLGSAVGGPAPAAYAAEVSSPHARGLAMGAFRTAGDLGLLIGPPALGLVADVSGYTWAFWSNAGILAAAAVALGVVAGRRRTNGGGAGLA